MARWGSNWFLQLGAATDTLATSSAAHTTTDSASPPSDNVIPGLGKQERLTLQTGFSVAAVTVSTQCTAGGFDVAETRWPSLGKVDTLSTGVAVTCCLLHIWPSRELLLCQHRAAQGRVRTGSASNGSNKATELVRMLEQQGSCFKSWILGCYLIQSQQFCHTGPHGGLAGSG